MFTGTATVESMTTAADEEGQCAEVGLPGLLELDVVGGPDTVELLCP